MTSLSVSEVIAEFLCQAGVAEVYGAPGTTELSLLLAASKHRLTYYCTLHDTVAVGMADGHARRSGKFCVVNLHSCQGLLNAAGFIRVAKRDCTPLLIVAGIPATTYDIYEPNHFVPNLQQILAPITKWCWVLTDSGTTRRVLNRAAGMAVSPPKGPTALLVPQNVLEGPYIPAEEELTVGRLPRLSSTSPVADAVEQAAKALMEAKRPVIFAGIGCQECCQLVEAIADLVAAPIISEALDRGPQLHNVYCRTECPLFAGFFDLRDTLITQTMHQADLLMFVGGRTTYPRVIGRLPRRCTVLHLEEDAEQIGKRHCVDVALIGDTANSLQLLHEKLWGLIRAAGIEQLNALRKKRIVSVIRQHRIRRSRTLGAISMKGTKITGFQLIKAMNTVLPANAILVDDSQCMGSYVKRYRSFSEARTLYGSVASHLGWALPASLGIKQASGSELVVCLIGDGSFMFSLQALATAVMHRLPVLIIIANNRGFVSLKSELAAKDRLTAQVAGWLSLDKYEIHFAQLAEALGAKGMTVRDASGLLKALRVGVAAVEHRGSPCVIDVRMSDDWQDWKGSWFVPSTDRLTGA